MKTFKSTGEFLTERHPASAVGFGHAWASITPGRIAYAVASDGSRAIEIRSEEGRTMFEREIALADLPPGVRAAADI